MQFNNESRIDNSTSNLKFANTPKSQKMSKHDLNFHHLEKTPYFACPHRQLPNRSGDGKIPRAQKASSLTRQAQIPFYSSCCKI